MIDACTLITARRYGEIRMVVASEMTGDLSRVLAKFGLRPDLSMLVEHEKETANAILADLLWKDMAYEDECMPLAQANSLAESIIEQFSGESSRYFSNGNWAKRESWNPLTDATFDAGILITGSENKYFCIWFEDED